MPETLSPPAPPKPDPAPDPAPVAAPPPPPAPASAPEPDAFVAELNKKFDADGVPPAPEPAPAKGKETPAKVEPVKAEPIKTKEPAEERPTPEGWKRLRSDRERLKTELQARETAVTDLQKKIADYEAKGKDSEQLLGRLQTLEKERDEAKAAAQRAKREVDDKFKETWDTPFSELAEDAAAVFNQLTATVTDASGNEQQRQASWDKDFSTIFAMDRGNASRVAKTMFGDESGLVMNYYDRLHENRRGRARALKKVEDSWAQAEKQEKEEAAQKQAQEEQNQGKFRDMQEKVFKEIGETVDDYHDPADVDKSITGERTKALDIWNTKATTLQGELIKRAHIKHRFLTHVPMKLKILRLEKELKEANEKLAGYKPKTPNPKSPGGEAGGGKEDEDWATAARKELL